MALGPDTWRPKLTNWANSVGSRGKKLLLVGALTCLVFAGVAGYGDFREVWQHLVDFPLTYLGLAFGLALVNYLLRFLRWAYYLRILNLAVPFRLSSLTFLIGLAMTITPGKVGELVKSYTLRDRAGVAVSSSAPVVLMERLTDLASVALMGLVGLALLPAPVSVVLAITLAGVAAVVYLLTTRHADRVLGWRVIQRWVGELREAQQAIRKMSRPGPFLVATALAFLAWLSEGLALWVVLEGLGADVGLLLSLPIYAGSVLVGAATTLPGGLVGTEGAMVTLLQQTGAERDVAAAGTLLVRVATLWFAVVVGLAAWSCLHWFVPKRADENVHESMAGETVVEAGSEGQTNG